MEAGKHKDHVTVCEPLPEPHEPSAPRVIPPTPGESCKCGETSRGGIAPGDREKDKEQGRNAGAVLDRTQADVPAHHVESGETVPTIDTERQEIRITEEEKRDRSKEEPCEKSLEKDRGQSRTLTRLEPKAVKHTKHRVNFFFLSFIML